MSLILDALRKSEAERRRGEAPSLYSSLPTPTTRPTPAWLRAAPWVLIALLVVGSLVALLGNDEAPATKAELGVAKDAPHSQDVAATSMPVATPPIASVPAAAPPPASSAMTSSAPTPTVDALVKTPSPTTAAPPTIATVTPVPVTEPMPAQIEPAPPAEEALPPLAVLEPSTRTSLPPLKLSMHVYDSEPARRFAIIDGQRVTEGAQLGSAVVTEIRRDGVVLDVGGRRVIVPRP